MMENTTIVNYSELTARLTVLKSERDIQEIVLKQSFTEFVSSINIFSFFKSSNTTTNSFQSNDLIKSGLTMAVNLIAGLVFGKNRSIKGFLSTLMIERFAKMMIDNNLINTFANIGSMIFSKNSKS